MQLSELESMILTKDWSYLSRYFTRDPMEIDQLRDLMDDLKIAEADQARVLVDSGLVTAPHCGFDPCPTCEVVDAVACLPGFDYNLNVEHGLVLAGLEPMVASDLVNMILELEWIEGQGIVKARPFGRCSVVVYALED